jgi:hypothetical protein
MILGILISVDGYMNLHLANTEEYIDGTNTGALGEVLIRFISQFQKSEVRKSLLNVNIGCK